MKKYKELDISYDIILNILPFYEKNIIRFQIIYHNKSNQKVKEEKQEQEKKYLDFSSHNDSDVLVKPDIFKTRYHEIDLKDFKKLFPIQ